MTHRATETTPLGDLHSKGLQLAFIHDEPAPLEDGSAADTHVLFCGGFHSSMHGNKARALAAYCESGNHAFTRFDYRGHGDSEGDPAAFTLADWLDDALIVFDAVSRPARPVIVVGSSMGAWIAVHLVLRRRQQVAALALIAAAPDFLHERLPRALDADARRQLENGGVARLATPADPAGYPITQALIDSGRALALLSSEEPHPIGCPVRMLHGTADDVAPWQKAMALMQQLDSDDASLQLIRHGDHRLSSPRELHLLARTLDELCTMPGIASHVLPAASS